MSLPASIESSLISFFIFFEIDFLSAIVSSIDIAESFSTAANDLPVTTYATSAVASSSSILYGMDRREENHYITLIVIYLVVHLIIIQSFIKLNLAVEIDSFEQLDWPPVIFYKSCAKPTCKLFRVAY